MHPAFMWYWKHRSRGLGDACASYAYAGCDVPRMRRRRHGEALDLSGRRHAEEDLAFGVGSFGVRRPLRFLASRLDLDDEQFGKAARILEALKIERAQAAVDLRRSSADLAEAVESSEFGRAQAQAARERRIAAAERVQDAVAKALEQLHELLDPDQRDELATLIRSGQVRL